MVQHDGLGRALRDADAAALAGGRLYVRLLRHRVDARYLVRADPHARKAGGAFLLVHLGHHTAGLDDRLGEDGGGAAGGREGLADALFDALGVVGRAAEEDALGGEVHGA